MPSRVCPERRFPADSWSPGQSAAQLAACRGEGKRLMSGPSSARITCAVRGPTPVIVSRRTALSAAGRYRARPALAASSYAAARRLRRPFVAAVFRLRRPCTAAVLRLRRPFAGAALAFPRRGPFAGAAVLRPVADEPGGRPRLFTSVPLESHWRASSSEMSRRTVFRRPSGGVSVIVHTLPSAISLPLRSETTRSITVRATFPSSL